MKSLTLTTDEIKALDSGRVVIWREAKNTCYCDLSAHGPPSQICCRYQAMANWKCVECNHDISCHELAPCPYQAGAEFRVCEKTYPVSTESTTYQALLCDVRTTPYRVRVVSVSPEQRETWGWRVELEKIVGCTRASEFVEKYGLTDR